MKHIPRFRILSVLLLFLALNSVFAQQITEPALKATLQLGNYEVTYQDEHGKSLTFEQFVAKMMEGVAVGTKKDAEQMTATVYVTEESNSPKNDFKLAVGDPVPVPSGTDQNGDTNSYSISDGKYTILSFFFSTCVPCIQEIPALNQYIACNADTRVVGITFDSFEVTSEFIAKHGVQFSTISDAQDYIDRMGVKTYPFLVLVGPGGEFLAKKSGGQVKIGKSHMDFRDLEEWVETSKDEA